MKIENLYIKSLPLKSKSTFGNWKILVRKTVTYTNGMKRDFDDFDYFWHKKDADNVINIFKEHDKIKI